MNIITQPFEDPNAAAARQLVEKIQRTKGVILAELRHNISFLFDQPDPQAVIDILGVGAVQVFAHYEALAGFAEAFLTQAGDVEGLADLEQIKARVVPYTIEGNEITLHFPPAHEPEQTTEEGE